MSKGFPWTNLDDRQAAFLAARAFFDDVKNEGIKKIPKDQLGKNLPSFIRRDDGKILAIGRSQKGGFLGGGGYGRVKYAMDINGAIYALKIETTNNSDQQQETIVAQDVGLMEGEKTKRVSQSTKTPTGEKYYSSLIFLGDYALDAEIKDLDAFSSNIHQKIADARKLCWELNQLHTGALSKKGLKLAHGDIKLSNIIRNEKNELKLIDYGLSAPIDRLISSGNGTFLYMPHDDDETVFMENIQKLGRVGMDIFALKRTLYLCSRLGNAYQSGDCIFSDAEFNRLPKSLKEMIDTTNIGRAIDRAPQDTLLKLTMHFIALESAHFDIGLYNETFARMECLDLGNQVILCSEFSSNPTMDVVQDAIRVANELSSISGSKTLKEKYHQDAAREDVAADSPTTIVNFPPSP